MSRLRVSDERVVVNAVRDKWMFLTSDCNVAPSWKLNTPITTAYYYGSYRTMEDVIVPGFHRRAQKGEVFFNPLSVYEKRVTSNAGSGAAWTEVSMSCSGTPNPYQVKTRYEGNQFDRVVWLVYGRDSVNMQNGGPSVIPSSDLSALLTEASTSCANNRVRSESNLYETIAEFDKTLSLLQDILSNVRKVVSLKRSILSRAKETSNAYLAYRYGLKPLMSDVETIVSGLSKKVGKLRVSSRGSAAISATSIAQVDSPAFDNALITTLRRSTQESVKVRALSLDEFDVSAGFNSGFSSKGLITLPWELLPYSFVVDWFANVGDYLGAMVPTLDALQLGSCSTVEKTIITDYAAIGCRASSSAITMDTPISGSMRVEEITKTRTPGLVAPGLVIKSDFRFSQLTRVLDSIALTVQHLNEPGANPRRKFR